MSQISVGGGGGGSTGANPTATASDTAVNGVAVTFMRSDAAPKVQLTSSSQFGLCKVDNVTITAAGGVITSVGSGAVSSVTANDTTVTISPTTGAVLVQVNLARANHWTDATQSTSTGTGAIITDGGVGVAKNVWVGGNINLPHVASSSGAGNLIFGASSVKLRSTGTYSIWIGDSTNYTADDAGSSGNVIIGTQNTGNALTSGFGNVAIGGQCFTVADTAQRNFSLGRLTLNTLTSGTDNVAIGNLAGNALATGSYNCFIGQGAGSAYNGAETANTIFGAFAGTVGESNCIIFSDPQNTNIRLDYNHTNANGWSLASGFVVGAATGGYLGAGKINVHGGIFLDNTAYTNPDFVLEHYYSGKVEKFVSNPRAESYTGLMPIGQLRDFVKGNWHLPRIHRSPSDIFERGDMALEKIEELTLYILELEDRIKRLEAR